MMQKLSLFLTFLKTFGKCLSSISGHFVEKKQNFYRENNGLAISFLEQ